MSAGSQAITFLVDTVFTIYIYFLLLRLMMQKAGVSWHNPMTQGVTRLTDPLVRPFKRIFRGGWSLQLSILIIAYLLVLIEFIILNQMVYGGTSHVINLSINSLGMLISMAINILMIVIIGAAILSWFPNARNHPAIQVIYALAQPITSIVRRYIKPMGGLDFSPLIILVILQLINILLAKPLMNQII